MFICLALVYGIKEKVFMTLVKDHKADCIQGRLLQWGFVVGKRDWTQLQI